MYKNKGEEGRMEILASCMADTVPWEEAAKTKTTQKSRLPCPVSKTTPQRAALVSAPMPGKGSVGTPICSCSIDSSRGPQRRGLEEDLEQCVTTTANTKLAGLPGMKSLLASVPPPILILFGERWGPTQTVPD